MQDFELIINKPKALNLNNKITSVSVTFVFWIILFYLWQPL
ncbi:MAG TPA: poly-beta-1,6-N-acetyl-D-glucosamine biosynthesis protein PgaD, partial [Oceanospirillales bacterium]|nr:poly-beta-1,6-N-acetyl-D-glucosamine biosynthesis protein PgaD [Oceanospirillales bacterium]